jgi:nucleoside-diphosphate-sugar epimerase
LIAPYADAVEFVIVADITAEGAFDSVLEGVSYIEHLASPLPAAVRSLSHPGNGEWDWRGCQTEDVEKDIIIPAIKGTTSILSSALKFHSIRRVVITSSVVAIVPPSSLMGGDDQNVFTANSRVTPLPTAPWGTAAAAYFTSKTLALDATEKFLAEKKPHFSIVSIMPGFILGRSELVTVAEDLLNSTNVVVLGPVLGHQMPARPCEVVDVRDVARIHVGALDEKKVVGSKSFLLDAGRMSFDDANEIAAREFPDAVKAGILPLGGSIPSKFHKLDTSDTVKTFGPMHTYEEAAKEVIGQYLELKAKAWPGPPCKYPVFRQIWKWNYLNITLIPELFGQWSRCPFP